MMPVRTLTQAELMAEAAQRFGDDTMSWAFQCPNCGDVATFGDFRQAGAGPELCGQECIGRSLGEVSRLTNDKGYFLDRGCNWVAYGLFRGPWEVVVPAEDGRPERRVYSFALAGAVTE